MKIKRLAWKLGYDITKLKGPRDPLIDIQKCLHNDHPLIFDVGANEGQSIKEYRSKFPTCTIHSFEPSPTTFEKLKKYAIGFKDVHLRNCALGSSSGQMTFFENTETYMSSLLPLGKYGYGTIKQETLVKVETIDQFCQEKNIGRIDLLKVDTQGFELEVLKGAEHSFGTNKIGLVYLEVNFDEIYKNSPSFAELYRFLESRDFLLVSFYKFSYHLKYDYQNENEFALSTNILFVHKSYLKKKN